MERDAEDGVAAVFTGGAVQQISQALAVYRIQPCTNPQISGKNDRY